MKKVLKAFIASSLVFIMTTGLAFAQASYYATGYTLPNDVDLATNYKFYKDAKVNDFIVSTGLNNSNINLDFAKQFDKVYLGLSYDGNFWGHNTSTVAKSEMSKNTNTSSDFYNSLSGFVGFDNNMTLGLYVYTKANLSSTKNEPKKGETVKSKQNSVDLQVGAKWTGDFNTSNVLVKPHFQAYYTTVINDNEPKQDYSKINNIELNLGSDFVTGSRDSFYSDVYANYCIAINNKKSFNAKDKETGAKSEINNQIYVEYRTSYKVNDKLTLASELDASMDFNFAKVLSASGERTSSDFIFKLSPSLYAGAKYAFVPSKFTLATGLYMNLPNFITTTTKNELLKTETTNTYFNRDENGNNRNFGIGLRVGFDWNITENLALDMGTYVPLGSNSNLFNNMSIGVSYRK